DFEFSRACASVLTEMNSTPSRCSSIIRLTALPPPPPTPTTFIRAFWEVLSSNSKIIAGGTPNEWRERGPKFGRNIMLSSAMRPHPWSEKVLQPRLHSLRQPVHARRRHTPSPSRRCPRYPDRQTLAAVERETY